ncbi:MAG: bifunctional DNA-binding transcriptional regulator/O6-methylguanine-DNA methyltransferase Ada [Alcanivoracaceae bacterium]|nr:bifunctional DNA-binding transcriptional regulator/O6-methylguanine-DNA methyltransferase Ada [Alcanivoracaceae bacterium]
MAKSESGLVFAEDNSRWSAVQQRDVHADGCFVFAVVTTGVYCRPSCPARLPKRENVRFFTTSALASEAGFRACKRCLPDEAPLVTRQAALVEELSRFIETTLDDQQKAPTLEMLADRANLSRHHLHRLFKSVTGVTAKQYADAYRKMRVQRDLTRKASVTQTMYDSGFNSSGHFYSQSSSRLGMTPGQYRQGGAEMTIRFAVGQCSLGAILVAQSERGVCAILMDDDPHALVNDLQDRFPKSELIGADKDFEKIVAQVIGFVEQPDKGINLPLDIRGTAFQQRVWAALQKIPAGNTVSYSQLAQIIGSPNASRAVAKACAANPLAVAVPCHRVVRMDGGLSGYRWGVERKRALLENEMKAKKR